MYVGGSCEKESTILQSLCMLVVVVKKRAQYYSHKQQQGKISTEVLVCIKLVNSPFLDSSVI